MPMDLTNEVLEGYDAEPEATCAYYKSSPAWLAWNCGHYLGSKMRHTSRPRKAAASRGDCIRVDNVVWHPVGETYLLWRR
jgi:hypothetical protein